jgi:hypothetical protein
VLGYAQEAYADAVQRNPAYAAWLDVSPAFGTPRALAG